MRKLITALGVLGVLTLATGLGSAADPNAPKGHHPPEHDPEAIFRKIDTNHDGKISKGELVKFAQERVTEWAGMMFDKADTDHDGHLTLSEYKKAAEKVRGSWGPEKEDREHDPEAIFKEIDTDHDGKVSKAEVLRFTRERAAGWAGKLFDQFDTDHDGHLTLSEFKKAVEKMRERFQKGQDRH